MNRKKTKTKIDSLYVGMQIKRLEYIASRVQYNKFIYK